MLTIILKFLRYKSTARETIGAFAVTHVILCHAYFASLAVPEYISHKTISTIKVAVVHVDIPRAFRVRSHRQ
ncbi:hypothetical protein WA026_001638, partial [Henosepilachna vigintioctopunctata]